MTYDLLKVTYMHPEKKIILTQVTVIIYCNLQYVYL